MAKQTQIKFNLDGLDNLRKQLGNSYVTRVGILGGKAAREDDAPMNNAEIGLIHEFGSEGANIPPRSFLRLPLEEKRRELMKAFASNSTKAAIESGEFKQVFLNLGIKAEEIIQEAFASGGFGHWPALKASTVASKGSSAILIDTGQLRRAITSDVVKRGSV